MITLPLTLIADTEADWPTAAGAVYLPVADPQVWLEAACSWDATEGLKILPIADQSRWVGALLVLGRPISLAPSGRGIPCRIEGGKVWRPWNARISPTLLSDEFTSLFPQTEHFLHPSLGLFGWRQDEILRPWDLLARPLFSGHTWEMAAAGPTERPPLRSIQLEISSDEDLNFLTEGGKEVGDRDLSDLKERPSPAKRLLRDGLSFGLGLAGKGLTGLLGAGNTIGRWFGRGAWSKSPASGDQDGNRLSTAPPGYLNFLRDWVKKQSEALDRQRENELQRLSRLLRENPTEGLRYALPLDGGDASRGFVSNPGAHLARHDISWDRRHRSGPTDSWALDAQWRARLEAQYREAAGREIKAGRPERAAYIYAQLLGQWGLAAQCLQDAGRHREAARIYLERLKDSNRAAECYLNGGYFVEALELYQQLGQHERCGDLLAKFGRRDEAIQAWMKAMGGRDRIHDARILETKLNEPGWAASVLASGWPASPQAHECIEEHFALLERWQGHDELRVQCQRLAAAITADAFQSSPEKIAALLGRLCPMAKAAGAGDALALAAIPFISRKLVVCHERKTREQLLKTLVQFQPGDRLLKDDVARFLAPALPPAKLPLRNPVTKPIKPRHTLAFSKDIQCLDMITTGGSWLLLGQEKHGPLVVLAGDEASMLAPRSLGTGGVEAGWLLGESPHSICCVTTPQRRWLNLELPLAGRRNHAVTLRSLLLPSPPLAILPRRNDSEFWALLPHPASAGVEIALFRPDGHLVRSRLLDWGLPGVSRCAAVRLGDLAYFAIGHSVHGLELGGKDFLRPLGQCSFPADVTALAIHRHGKSLHLAAVWGSVVVVMKIGRQWETVEVHGDSACCPAIAFLPDGNLVVLDETGGYIYAVEGKVRCLAKLQLPNPGEEPVAVVSLDVSTFVGLWADNTIYFFEGFE